MKRTPLKRKTPLKRSAWGGTRGNKFRAKAYHDGERSHASLGEGARWRTLSMYEKGGAISGLEHQPRIVLVAGDKTRNLPEIAYRPDSSYVENGRRVWEDWKPRPETSRDTIIYKLWRHFGPGLLRITGRKNGKDVTIKEFMGGRAI